MDKYVPPWEQPNDNGELPGDICCQRATGRYCYEHNPDNYHQECLEQHVPPLTDKERIRNIIYEIKSVKEHIDLAQYKLKRIEELLSGQD